jgi:hypothetical protein
MEAKPTCEDVTIPDPLVKVDGCRLPAVSTPNNRDKQVNERIVDRNVQIITSGLRALLRRIRALTKLFSAKKRRKQFLTY